MLATSGEIRKEAVRRINPSEESEMTIWRRFRKYVASLGVVLMSAAGCGEATPTAPVEHEAGASSLNATAAVAARIAPGGPYNLRAGPGTNHALAGQIAGGTHVTITCQAYGTTHSGPWGSTNIWDRLSTGKWISDAFVYTGRNGLVAPLCSNGPTSAIPAGVRGDNYTFRNDPAIFRSNECHPDPWRFCKRNCTSFVAFRLNRVNNIAFHNRYRSTTNAATDKWGHAMYWANRARGLGFTVDRTPQVGAVAHWNSSRSRPYGHVAWVAAVSGDGRSVTIEEYNFNNRGTYRATTIATSSVDNFIHVR